MEERSDERKERKKRTRGHGEADISKTLTVTYIIRERNWKRQRRTKETKEKCKKERTEKT